MWEKIKEIIKDLLIVAYGVTLLVFFLNILFFGIATWTEKGWRLWGEIITFAIITGLGLFWFIKDIKNGI